MIKKNYEEKILPHCHFVHHKPHMDCTGIEFGLLRCEAGDYSPETWHGILREKLN
jgi:hypothetical protein